MILIGITFSLVPSLMRIFLPVPRVTELLGVGQCGCECNSYFWIIMETIEVNLASK